MVSAAQKMLDCDLRSAQNLVTSVRLTGDAVALVLQAFAIGCNGDILVLDMGEPVSILGLARTLIRLSGKSEQSVQIQFTGLREGEKSEEDLFYASEEVHPTRCDGFEHTRSAQDGWSQLQQCLEELRANLNSESAATIRERIKQNRSRIRVR